MKLDDRKVIFSISFLLLILIQCKDGQRKADDNLSEEAAGWFKTERVADRVWCIEDHGSDNIYLVEGDDKALLIDTGTGVGDLAGCVKKITHLPVIVVNTHGHPDHAGGNFQFPELHTHPLDFEMVRQFSGKEYHKNAVQRAIAQFPDFESSFVREMSAGHEPAIVSIRSGYVFDLGKRKLEVIEVPGHTKGSIVLLDKENKLLFTGDNNNTVVWLFLDGCLPLESYLETLKNLNKQNEEFDLILPGHGGVMDKSFIDEQIICVENIISGECKGEKYESFAGPALVCAYERARVAYNPLNIYIR